MQFVTDLIDDNIYIYVQIVQCEQQTVHEVRRVRSVLPDIQEVWFDSADSNNRWYIYLEDGDDGVNGLPGSSGSFFGDIRNKLNCIKCPVGLPGLPGNVGEIGLRGVRGIFLDEKAIWSK